MLKFNGKSKLSCWKCNVEAEDDVLEALVIRKTIQMQSQSMVKKGLSVNFNVARKMQQSQILEVPGGIFS